MTENANLKERFTKIITLQEIDSEIFDLTSQKEEFPHRIKELDALLEEKKTGMETAKNELNQLQVEKGDKENDLAAGEERVKKHEGELALIKTNKEYTTMLEQIDSVKADISLLEEKVLELFDRIALSEAKYEEEEKTFEDNKKECDAAKAEIKSEESKMDVQLSELKNKRVVLTGEIDAKILSVYERVLENRGRRALSKINGEICGECNLKLRPQVINEASMQKKLVICENCSRILYTED